MKHILTLSDIHYGKSDVTKKIASSIVSFFIKNKKELSKLYAIVLTGDVFDKMLTTNSLDYKIALSNISFIVSFCRRHNIKLRVLEGTPSHDNKQMSTVSSLIQEIGDIDYKYIDTLSIEYIDGMTWMYLPDKYKDSGEEIQQAIIDKLKEHNLAKVDIIFAHGNFAYQLPVKIKSTLDENFFLSITNYYIVIGHIHNRSIWLRIIAPGSFQRLEHNQEIDKGAVLLIIGKTIDDSSFKFMINEEAMKYDTIDLLDLDVKDSYKKIKKHIQDRDMSEDDAIRLKTSNENFTTLLDRLISDGIPVKITKYIEKSKTTFTDISSIEIEEKKIDTISISSKNIYDMLLKREAISVLSDATKKRLKEILLDCDGTLNL